MKTIALLLAFCAYTILCLPPAGAQSTPDVTNVVAYQDDTGGRDVHITYDLAISGGSATADVWVLISDDGGLTYSLLSRNLSGDVGADITAGTGKHIIWNAIADLPNVYGTNYRAKVTAWSPDCEGLTVTLPGGVPLELVCIPAGSFMMGSMDDASWSHCYPCEQPVHQVNIGYDFYMGKYEITQAQWVALMGSWPGEAPHVVGDNYPAYHISWDDWQDFITALNQHIADTGQGPATFRMPSEAEWEYACRAGTTTRFYFGDSTCSASEDVSCDLDNYAWWGVSGYVEHPVGGKLPNSWGLFDMHGGVWEWCQDYWHDDYTGAPVDGSAWEYPTHPARVVRGALYGHTAKSYRSAARDGYGQSLRNGTDGLRVVRDQ